LKPPHRAYTTATKYKKVNAFAIYHCITTSADHAVTIPWFVTVPGFIAAFTAFNPINDNHAIE
jgi:hypothetical protein